MSSLISDAWSLIEQAIGIAFVLSFWIGIPVYVVWKIRSRRGVHRAKAEVVTDATRRTQRSRVAEIEAEPLRDFRGPGRKGEPFIAPGGWLALIGLITTVFFYYYAGKLVRDVIGPWLDRMIGLG